MDKKTVQFGHLVRDRKGHLKIRRDGNLDRTDRVIKRVAKYPGEKGWQSPRR